LSRDKYISCLKRRRYHVYISCVKRRTYHEVHKTRHLMSCTRKLDHTSTVVCVLNLSQKSPTFLKRDLRMRQKRRIHETSQTNWPFSLRSAVWQSPIGSLIFIRHFPQKSTIIRVSFARRAAYGRLSVSALNSMFLCGCVGVWGAFYGILSVSALPPST